MNSIVMNFRAPRPCGMLLLPLLLLAILELRAAPERHPLTLRIQPQFNGAPLLFDGLAYTNAAGQCLSVTRLDFLVSRVQLRRTGGEWISVPDEFAYISGRDARTDLVLPDLRAEAYDRVRFAVGVPATENHADPTNLAPGHPLNPNFNGLHWNWQGGYVFLALEGNWRQPQGGVGGFSYHIATDRLLMAIELPIQLDLHAASELRLILQVDRIFSSPHRLHLTDDTASTHSRETDPLAGQLRENIARAFAVEGVQIPALVPSITNRPGHLEIAATATPYRLSYSRFSPVRPCRRIIRSPKRGWSWDAICFTTHACRSTTANPALPVTRPNAHSRTGDVSASGWTGRPGFGTPCRFSIWPGKVPSFGMAARRRCVSRSSSRSRTPSRCMSR